MRPTFPLPKAAHHTPFHHPYSNPTQLTRLHSHQTQTRMRKHLHRPVPPQMQISLQHAPDFLEFSRSSAISKNLPRPPVTSSHPASAFSHLLLLSRAISRDLLRSPAISRSALHHLHLPPEVHLKTRSPTISTDLPRPPTTSHDLTTPADHLSTQSPAISRDLPLSHRPSFIPPPPPSTTSTYHLKTP